MTATATKPRPTETSTADDDLDHIYCLDCTETRGDGRDISFCGLDVTDLEYYGDYTGPDPEVCIVCVDLNETHDCPEPPK